MHLSYTTHTYYNYKRYFYNSYISKVTDTVIML
jgi:hypothetical protein